VISQSSGSRVRVLATRGRSLVVRGAVAIAFAVAIPVAPPTHLLSLLVLWGTFAFTDGIICAVVAVWARGDGARCGWLAFEGLVSLATGTLTLLWPDLTPVVLLNLVVGWTVLIGVSEVVGAIRLRPSLMRGERVLAGASIVAFALCAVLLVVVGPRALASGWLTEACSLLFGALLIALGIGADRWRRVEARIEC
jgi:uncharacterized membrane protein HdeD (DUF308 family)